MKFRIKSTCFINMPTHLANDPPGMLRNLPQTIKAEPMFPVEIDLPDDIDPNSISRTWEPLDDRARAAQGKLKESTSKRPVTVSVDQAAIVDFLATLPTEAREEFIKHLAQQHSKAKAAEGEAGTMKAVTDRAAANSKKP